MNVYKAASRIRLPDSFKPSRQLETTVRLLTACMPMYYEENLMI